MKRMGPFKWTPKADQAVQDLKKYLASPPVMVVPHLNEPLQLYLMAMTQTTSAVLMAQREQELEPHEAAE